MTSARCMGRSPCGKVVRVREYLSIDEALEAVGLSE